MQSATIRNGVRIEPDGEGRTIGASRIAGFSGTTMARSSDATSAGSGGSTEARSAAALLLDTQRYYAEWTDADPRALVGTDTVAICSKKRDERLPGYSRAFQLYVVVTGQAVILSYAREISAAVPSLLKLFGERPCWEGMPAAIGRLVPGNVSHSLKFGFCQLPDGLDTSSAAQLKAGQYADYLQFFQTQHPDASPEGWLEDYYASLADRGYAYGVYDDHRLVCATDAPDIPFMSDVIVEPGINTLGPYRRRGFAKAAVGAMLRHLLAMGKTPIWSCRATNEASQALAMGVGFRKFADVFTVSANQPADQTEGPP
jgi:GNAT acetyltransferase-like protein